MKSSLLGLSLVANVALVAGVAYLVLRPSVPHDPAKTTSATVPTQAIAAPNASTTPAANDFKVGSDTALPTDRWQSPAEIDAWLKSSGAPLNVRYAVLNHLLMEKYKQAGLAVRFPAGMKRWQRSSYRPTQGQTDQLVMLRQQQQQEMEALFGADYAKARFGAESEAESGIPAEKRVEIDRVLRDYMDTRMKLGPGRSPAERELLESEMQKDLARILTPEEYDLYQAYESQEGQRLQRALVGVDIDDDTYLKAFRIVSETKRLLPPSSTSNLRQEELDALKEIVGPRATAQIAMNQDGTFREISSLYLTAGLSPDSLLDRHQTWQQYHKDIRLFQQAQGRLDDSQKSLVLSYYNRMIEGLSTAARAEFDRTNAGRFMNRLLGAK